MGNPVVRRQSNSILESRLSLLESNASVLAQYTSGFLVLPSNTYTPFVPNSKVRDVLNAYNASTGAYTVQPGLGGEYEIKVGMYYGATAGTTSDIQIMVQKNGVDYLAVNTTKSGTTSVAVAHSGVIPVLAVPGDVLTVRVIQITGGSVTMISSGVFNWMSIRKVGA